MIKVIVDEALRSKLHDLSQPLELCEESGRILARLVPAVDSSNYDGLEPQISVDELRRRVQNKGKTYSTAEVLEHLRKL